MLRTLLTALILAAALVTPPQAPRAQTEAEAASLSVILDWYVNPNHAPLVIAEAQGDFAAANLDVEITAPSDPSLPPRLVAAGQADLAISYQPQLHLQVDAGLPVARVGALIATPLNCVMVRADNGVATLADLRGRRVGYSVAGVDEAVISSLLAPHGLTLDDVELINVNWSLTPALVSGQVDAVIGAYRTFELTQMRLAGVEGRCFFVEQEGSPVYDELIFIANRERLAEDPAFRARVRRFLTAVEAATHRIVNDPEAMWEIFSASGDGRGDALNRAAWTDSLARFSLSPAALDRGRYLDYAAYMAELDLIAEAQSWEDVAVDLSAD